MIKPHFKSILYITSLLTIITIVLFIDLNIADADFSKPFYYNGDVTQYFQLIKSMVDNGWIQENPLLGFPHGQFYYDFPITDYSNWIIMKFISIFTNNWAEIINCYYILTFYIIGLASFFSMKKLGLMPFSSLIGSILFTFLPYHFARNENHLGLGAYYVIPFVFLLSYYVLFQSKPFFEDIITGEKKSIINYNFILIVFICALIATSFLYYTYFSIIIIAISGVIGSIKLKKRYPIIHSVFLIGLIILILVLLNIPHIYYYLQNGGSIASAHNPGDSEIYGLKIVQLLLPMENHRFSIFASIGEGYSNSAPLVNENSSSALGIIGSIGFLLLLLWFILRPYIHNYLKIPENYQNLLDYFGIINIIIVIYGTIGGFGTIFSYLIAPQFRALNRISMFIAFISIITFLIFLELGTKQFCKKRQPLCVILICILLLSFGIFDQTSISNTPPYKISAEEYLHDEKFVQNIESSLHQGDAVFQLPYVRFTPGPYPKKMIHFDDLKPYLYSKNIKWSAGGFVGRYGDDVRFLISQKSGVDLMNSLCIYNFTGLFIDKYGYENISELDKMIQEYSDILKINPLISDNGRYVFFPIKEYCNNTSLTEEEICNLNPFVVSYRKGFYQLEQYNNITWHWCSNYGIFEITNPVNKTMDVTIKAKILFGTKTESSIRIGGDIPDQEFIFDNKDSYQEVISVNTLLINATLKPGINTITISSKSAPLLIKGDRRNLIFRIQDLMIMDRDN